jgi:anti-sigma B factor antagonist
VATLSLETSISGPAAVVAISGELDLAGAAALEQELERLTASLEGAVVLDLRGVDFIDSSGLRAIAVSAQRAQSLGRRLALIPGPDPVMRVFEITRMRDQLEFVDDPRAGDRRLGEISDHVPPRRLEDARLVANAIRHADLSDGDVIRLVVVTGDRALRIEVCDPGQGFEPPEPGPDPARPSGWGLYLVRELSDRWGVEHHGQTRVWFELDRGAA